MRFFLILILFYSNYILSQKIDYTNFDHEILQSKLLNKLSQFRSNNNLDTLYQSKILKNHISDKVVNLNSEKDSLYVVFMETINDSINNLLYYEMKKDSIDYPIDIFIERTTQLICVITEEYNTYEELSNVIVKNLMKSQMNRSIILSKFLDKYGKSGLFSCSSKFSTTGKLYISINFITLGYF